MVVNVTTTSTAEVNTTLEAYVDPVYYDLTIDDVGTSVYEGINMTLLFTNTGQQNVILESIYVNTTYIPLPNIYVNYKSTWVPLTSSKIEAFEIGVGNSMELTVSVSTLNTILGLTIDKDEELVIVIRVEEGAEINHVEIVL
ncbi:MAG: hypothetical protein ACXAB8_07765 [Promethearchaeota archaeon]|jgi:hypothetical protein